jgi:hypothetical protein
MTSARQMNDYARYMKTNGFSVLSYFNVTEYGKHVNPRLAELPPGRAGDPDLWKDGSAYMKAKLPNAWLRIAASDRTEWGPPRAGRTKGIDVQLLWRRHCRSGRPRLPRVHGGAGRPQHHVAA